MASTFRQDAESRRNDNRFETSESGIVEDDLSLIESRRWIEEVTGKRFSSNDFRKSLKDGILLCELIETVGKFNVGRRNRLSTPYAEIDNLNLFLGGCSFLGLTRDQLFDVTDLQEVSPRREGNAGARAKENHKRLRNVAKTIYWVAKAAENREDFRGPYLDDKCFVTLVADAYKVARAKSPTFEYRTDRSFLNQTEPLLLKGHELNGYAPNSKEEFDNQPEVQYFHRRTDSEKESLKQHYPRRASTGSSLKENSRNMVQRRRYTEQFRTAAVKTDNKVNNKKQIFQELTQKADEEASVLQGNFSRHRIRRTSAGSVDGKLSRNPPMTTRDVNLNEKRKQFEERDRQASVDSDVLSGKVRRVRPKSYHGGDYGPVMSAGSKKLDSQAREKQQKYEKLQKQATLENEVLEGRLRQSLVAGNSKEDGKPRQQLLSTDVKLRDKQEKFEKLDRQAEIENAIIHGELRQPTSDDTVDSRKQTRTPVQVKDADVNLKDKQAKFENLDRQASHESAVLKGCVRMQPGIRSKDNTDAQSQVPIPRGEDVQFREKHRKFEHLDWKAEQESSILNKNRRKSSGKEIREFKPLSTASRPTVNQYGQTKPIGYENVPDSLITGSITRRTPYRIDTKRPKSNIYEYQPQVEENSESDYWSSDRQMRKHISETELNNHSKINAPHPPPRNSSLHRSTSPRPVSIKHNYTNSESSFKKQGAYQNFSAPSHGDEIEVSKLSYRDFVVPPSKNALEKREMDAVNGEAKSGERNEEIRKQPKYVQQTQKVHDMARRFVAQNQSPKDHKPPPRRALVDRDELERFERNTKAQKWYELEDDKRIDYRQLSSYNTNRPRRHSDGPASQNLDSPQEFTGKPDLSKSVPGDLHREYSPDDEVFLSPESRENTYSTSDEIKPLDMLTDRRTSYEEPVHTASTSYPTMEHAEPVHTASTSYPTMEPAEPVFMEPTEARRELYPTELHAKPHFVSPDHETQRYPKYGPEADKFPGTIEANNSYSRQTDLPAEHREPEAELQQSDIRLVHSEPGYMPWETRQTKHNAVEEQNTVAQPPAKQQNMKIVVRSVARSTIYAKPQKVFSVRAIPDARAVYKPEPEIDTLEEKVPVKPSSPESDKAAYYFSEGSKKPVDSWISYSDNSNPDSQDVINDMVKKTVQTATDVDYAVDQKSFSSQARGSVMKIEDSADAQQNFAVGQIGVKRFLFEQPREDAQNSTYNYSFGIKQGMDQNVGVPLNSEKGDTVVRSHMLADDTETIQQEEHVNCVEEEPIIPSTHHPDRTLPGWDFNMEALESNKFLARPIGEPRSTEYKRYNGDQAYRSYNNKLEHPQANIDSNEEHHGDHFDKTSYFSSYPTGTSEESLSYETSLEAHQDNPLNRRHGNRETQIPQWTTNQHSRSESSDDSFASPIKYRMELVTPPHGDGYDYRDIPKHFPADNLSSPEYREKLRKELKQKNQKQREDTEYLLQRWRTSKDYEDDFDVKLQNRNNNKERNWAEHRQLANDSDKEGRQNILKSNGQTQSNLSGRKEEKGTKTELKHKVDSPVKYGHRDIREISPEHGNFIDNETSLSTQSYQDIKRNGQEEWEQNMYRLPNGRQVKPEKLVKLVQAEENYWKKKMEKKKRRTSSETSENGTHEVPTSIGSTSYSMSTNGTNTIERKQRFAEINRMRDVPFDDPEKEERIRKLKAEEEFMAQEAERLMRAKMVSSEQAENKQTRSSDSTSDHTQGFYVEDRNHFPAEKSLHYGYNNDNQESLSSTTKSISLSGLNIYESFIHGKSNRVICSCCGRSIERAMSVYVVDLDKYWHMKCFRCAVCNKMFDSPESQKATKITADILHCEHCFLSEDGGCTEV